MAIIVTAVFVSVDVNNRHRIGQQIEIMDEVVTRQRTQIGVADVKAHADRTGEEVRQFGQTSESRVEIIWGRLGRIFDADTQLRCRRVMQHRPQRPHKALRAIVHVQMQVDQGSTDVAGKIDAANQKGNALGIQRIGLPGGVNGEKNIVGRTGITNPPADISIHVRLVPASDAAIFVLLLIGEPFKSVEAVLYGEEERLQWVGTRNSRLIADADARNHQATSPLITSPGKRIPLLALRASNEISRRGRIILTQSYLRARLDNVEASTRNGSLNILGRTEQTLHFHADASDGTQQLLAEPGVPDELFVAVVEPALFRLLSQKAIIKSRASKVRQIFVVGIGAKDHAFAVDASALAWIGENFRLQITLMTEEAECSAGIIANQRFAHAQDNLGKDLLARSGEGIGSVDDESILSRHDFLNEHGHLQAIVRDAARTARQVGAIVPFRCPDAADGVPRLRPRHRW